MRYALLISWLCFNLYAQSASQPNLVFLLIDDLGYADCGFNGDNEIKTPNIDRLAKSGTIIDSHYVQPVCSPTRSTLLTGRYSTHTGVYTIVSPGAPWERGQGTISVLMDNAFFAHTSPGPIEFIEGILSR